MKTEAFSDLVADALDSLPEDLLRHLENVDVVVEEWPGEEDLADAEGRVEDRRNLLGLYVGVPLSERDTHYGGFLPDRIVLFRGPLEHWTRGDPAALAEQVRRTVIHEFAHHYGIDDDRLEELGWG